MREESTRLEKLLESARHCPPTRGNEPGPIPKYQRKSKDSRKFIALLKAVRTSSPTKPESSEGTKRGDREKENETLLSKMPLDQSPPGDTQISKERKKDEKQEKNLKMSTASQSHPSVNTTPEPVAKGRTPENNSPSFASRNLRKSNLNGLRGKNSETNSSSSSQEHTPSRRSKLPSYTGKTLKGKKSPASEKSKTGAEEKKIHLQREPDPLDFLCQTGWLGAGETIPIPRREWPNEMNHLVETGTENQAAPSSRRIGTHSASPVSQRGSMGSREPTPGGSSGGGVTAPSNIRESNETPGLVVGVGPSLLMQAALDMSDLSEGEIVSAGRPSQSPNGFWS